MKQAHTAISGCLFWFGHKLLSRDTFPARDKFWSGIATGRGRGGPMACSTFPGMNDQGCDVNGGAGDSTDGAAEEALVPTPEWPCSMTCHASIIVDVNASHTTLAVLLQKSHHIFLKVGKTLF